MIADIDKIIDKYKQQYGDRFGGDLWLCRCDTGRCVKTNNTDYCIDCDTHNPALNPNG